jgi:hypothetical protein
MIAAVLEVQVELLQMRFEFGYVNENSTACPTNNNRAIFLFVCVIHGVVCVVIWPRVI